MQKTPEYSLPGNLTSKQKITKNRKKPGGNVEEARNALFCIQRQEKSPKTTIVAVQGD